MASIQSDVQRIELATEIMVRQSVRSKIVGPTRYGTRMLAHTIDTLYTPYMLYREAVLMFVA